MIAMNRRAVLGLGGLAFSGCGRCDPYFGNTDPPSDQELTPVTIATGGSPDPALCSDFLAEGQLIRTIFEGIAKGLGGNLLNREQFKYGWIDTNWRPQ